MSTNTFDTAQAEARYRQLFLQLQRLLPDISAYVTEDVIFEDPFNRVHGRQAMTAVMVDFVRQCQPQFQIVHCAWQGKVAYFRWEMTGSLGRLGEWRPSGVSEVHFHDDGRACYHRDYWDVGQQFYERLPLLGRIIRAIRRRLAHTSSS